MNAPAVVISFSPADVALFTAFHEAESVADTGRRPLMPEMIEVLDYARDDLGRSMRMARQEYAAPFDPRLMRHYVVMRYAIDLLERMAEHKAEVAPILFPELAPERRRA